nr:hypothetical protein [uncultured Rhodoferax sp.]
MNTKVLPPHLTVIDADTMQITYEQAKPSMLLADADRKYNAVLLLEIDCPEMYAEGADLLKKIVGAKKDLDEQRKANGKPLRTALEDINAGYNPAIIRLEEAETLTKRLMTKYIDDQAEKERVARVEQERLQRAEQERQRIAAAEALRVANEEAARARTAAAEAQRVANEEIARKNSEAEAARAAGDAEAAKKAEDEAAATQEAVNVRAAVIEQDAQASVQAANENAMAVEQVALMTTSVVVPISAPKVSGMSKSTKWTVNVTDPVEFLRFVADNYQHFSFFVEFNKSKLNGMAQAQKEAFKLPGCTAKGETKLASRRA